MKSIPKDMVKTGIAQRLMMIIEDKKLFAKQFCESVDIQLSEFTRIKKGESDPKYYNLKLTVEKYGVNPLWLLTGKGRMYGTTDESSLRKLENYGSQINNEIKMTEKHQIIKNQSESIKELTQTNQKLTDGMINLMKKMIEGSKIFFL